MPDATEYFFERSASDYEAHIGLHGASDELYAETAKALALKGALQLLDLWCGTGRELDAIMNKSPWVSVTGLDPSPALLAKLLAKPYASRLTLLSPRRNVPTFGADTFDAAVSVLTMHHFTEDDRRTIYGKVFEAIRPGGRYVEADRIALSEADEEAYRAAWKPADLANCERPITGVKIEAFLREAGFSSVERRYIKNDKVIYLAGKEQKK